MRYLKPLLALFLTVFALERGGAQANVIENQTTFIYVDATYGSDKNPGTVTAPFQTIQAGINLANQYNRSAVGTKVIVNPGVYREFVNIAGYDITTAVLTLEAATTGTVSIAGSDVLTGWVQVTPTVYSTSWTAALGMCPIPEGWPTNFAPIAQRAEMTFVNGVPLTQIMAYDDLIPGTFFIDDAASTIYVAPPLGTNMATALVEGATRAQTLALSNRTNVVLRGLRMRNAANCINSSAAEVSGSTNVLVDSIQSNWNNWGGFGVFMSTNVTVQNSLASYNGGVGFMGNQTLNSLFNFNETDYNNWRGAQAAFYDWGMGGTKLFAMHTATIENHYAYNNQAQGLWFDTDNKNITINQSTLAGNLLAALQMERNEGPVVLENSNLCSSGAGINILTSRDLTMQNNVLYNDGATGRWDQAQIFTAGQSGGIDVTDWETGEVYDLLTTGMTLDGNTIEDGGLGQIIMGTYLDASDWAQFATTLSAANNTYYDASSTTAFEVVNGKHLNLASWQSAVGTDTTSIWAAPAVSPAAACTPPAPVFSDFNMNASNRAYTMSSGKVVATIRVASFGFGLVNLSVEGVPTGVYATLSQPSLTSGMVTVTFTSSLAAIAQNLPVTVWGISGSRVHSVTFYVQIYPFATVQTTPTIAWPTPASIPYGRSLGTAQLDATLSVAGTCTYTPAAATMLPVGSHKLTASCVPADTIDYKTPPPASVTLVVNPAPLSVAASSPAVIYGSAPPAVTPNFTGFVNGESSSALTTQPHCTTTYTTTSAVGSSPSTSCAGAQDANYSITYIAGAVTIMAAAQTITFAAPATPVTYGVALIPLSAVSSSGLPIAFSTTGVCVLSGATLNINAVGTCSVTANQPGNQNFSAAPAVSHSLSVSPASLHITASSPTLSYGAAIPAISSGFSGFVHGDSSAALTSQPHCTTTYTTTSAPGSLPATSCAGAGSANYTITYTAGAVTITPATQTITFTLSPTHVTYGAAAIKVAATSTSTLPITFSATAGVCTVASTTLTIVAAGSCVVTASQAGNANYAAATPVAQTLVVYPAALTISASSPAVIYGSGVPAIAANTSGFVNGDSMGSLTTQPACSTAYAAVSPAGSSPATTCSAATGANYSISYINGAVTVRPANLTITASSPVLAYGSPVPVINPSYSGFVNAQNGSALTVQPACTTTYTPGSAVGSAPATTCSGAVDTNYSISSVNGAVTIIPPPATSTPTISLPSGTYTTAQTVTIADATPGAAIYYTTDGTLPTIRSALYTGAIPLSISCTIDAIAISSGSIASPLASATYTINLAVINFPHGFTAAGGMQLNGRSTLAGTALQLTDGNINEASSAFFAIPVHVGSFTTSFTLQQTAAAGDGMMFVIENAPTGAGAIGPSGSALGYSEGPTQPNAILNSIAIKFDLYSNSGEGPDSTGMYTDGAHPTEPSLNLVASGINLHSGDPMAVLLTYDGTTLSMTITDTVNLNTFTTSWPVDIPGTVGSNTAYVGFTGSSGAATAVQQVLSWTY